MNNVYEKESINGFCPHCNSFKDGKIVKRKIEAVVRGVAVEVVILELHCNDCGELLTSHDIDKRNDIVMFNEYKKAVGLLTTFEIKSIREKRRMSQEQMADFLAIDVKDIMKYENGAIQPKNIDMMIRMIDDDVMFTYMCMKFNKKYSYFIGIDNTTNEQTNPVSTHEEDTNKIKAALEKIERGYYALPLHESVPRLPRYTKIIDGKLTTVYHDLDNESKVYETFTFNFEDENKTWTWWSYNSEGNKR